MDNFLEKTLRDIQTLFSELFYAEITATKKGLLQNLDPRIKLLTFLGLLIAVNLTQTLRQLVIFYGYLLSLAVLSHLPLLPLCKRVAAIALVFTGLVMLPALFNFIRPGDPLWQLTDNIYITRQGLYGSVLMVLRSSTSLMLVFLLTTTTKWVNILKAIRVLKIPATFVTTLEMAQRYLFLSLEVAAQTFTARKSRTLGKCSGREDRHFVASATGNLLIRTATLGDEVYQAMLSRGYCGAVRSLDQFQTRSVDWIWVVWNLLVIIGIFSVKNHLAIGC
jgi:cobalt/nickel transport system permease protein